MNSNKSEQEGSLDELESDYSRLFDKYVKTRRLTRVAAIIAVIALLLGGAGAYYGRNAQMIAQQNQTWCAANATPGPSGPAGTPGPQGNTGAEGASAYTLWLSVGNKGSLQDFLDSLVGVKGPKGYVGSNGFTGADGADGPTGPSGTPGASAYQLWLDAGNEGTPEEFLTSLIGPMGPAGQDGQNGTNGTNGQDGTDGTNGINGTNGTNGAAGLSAYELWVAIGNTGTEADFLASLVGPAGSNGSNGTNGTDGKDGTNGTDGKDGTNGTNGADGKSAYQIWLDAGNTGTQADFLASLKGDPGVCTPGSGLGAWGSFFDTTNQMNDANPNLMTFNHSDVGSSGVSIQNGSRIVISKPGTYNIAFSAQVTRLKGGSSADVEIWLKQNGVDYPDSTTAITLQSNAQKVVAAWNFFVTTTNENEYFELAWDSTEPSMELYYRAANSTPAIPSVILTVNQVH